MKINTDNHILSTASDLNWGEGYLQWEKENNWNFNRIEKLSTKFVEYMRLYRIISHENIVKISKELNSVYGNCDNIPFVDFDQVTAYCLIHFLPRYRRIQLIFQELITKNIFPKINTEYPIHIIDIGTGPGPSLFAISDFFLSLKLYGKEKNIAELGRLDFKIDYVERSDGFREWIHHFTEYANGNSNDIEKDLVWRTPYHHGTFSDFADISFEEINYYPEIDDDGDYNTQKRVTKHRPHFIIASNFFTTTEMAGRFENELKDCVKFMKNKGVLIVTGGRGGKYKEINSLIESFVAYKNKNEKGFLSSCSRQDSVESKLSYNYSEMYAESIKRAKMNIFGLFSKELLEENVSADNLERIYGSIGESSSGKDSWGLQVYRKYSKLMR